MSSTDRQPLYLRSRKTISDTNEFWLFPFLRESYMPGHYESTTAIAGDGDRDDFVTSPSMLPAHHQLLSRDLPSYEDLKGRNHARESYGDDEPILRLRPKLSDVKRQGGGSWLLGFLSDESLPPGLVGVHSSDSESDHDDDSILSSPSLLINKRRRAVSFSPCVKIQPIPHSSTLKSSQRSRMYSSSEEIARNRIRNKKEYRYDGYEWRDV
eukprot:CAMPEP_0172559266 /NCGR_PEP_ID=MMETSP1067-20121228/83270_1 /TAXON_ID=265564 ORGANISM="Thalassiosira punctigera, Strain Tpunct2005C2" /NCGR_SAMPLE_ID=MMETSP1067 /ASSEMBLY_ACC=CAM_ASM_000444 /LENGTH=210 /DNA_ID=CAMNT_0013348819 /DNA_START=58 /DNA_END=686 /DNA_ORIENTATION=-